MADKKISALTAAAAPLAGTEVLPIVQSGSTVKVSVSNLTAGRAVSAASITNGLGAVGTPSYTFAGNTNTGMWSPSAGALAFSNGGAESVRVNSAGNVGIGTTTPSFKLQVSGAIAVTPDVNGKLDIGRFSAGFDGGALDFTGGTFGVIQVNNNERMRVTAAGNVGIGTSSPTSRLDVNGDLKTGNVVRVGLADTNNSIINIGDGATGNKFALLDFIGDTTYTDYGLRVGRLNNGPNGTSELQHRGTGVLSINAFDAGNILVSTQNTERMRVTAAGNVGINEASPDYRLDVNGAIGFTPGASVTPVDNGDVVFELTNNTTLTIKAKGSDGVVRSATLTLS
jgi:hypothetical protein